ARVLAASALAYPLGEGTGARGRSRHGRPVVALAAPKPLRCALGGSRHGPVGPGLAGNAGLAHLRPLRLDGRGGRGEGLAPSPLLGPRAGLGAPGALVVAESGRGPFHGGRPFLPRGRLTALPASGRLKTTPGSAER